MWPRASWETLAPPILAVGLRLRLSFPFRSTMTDLDSERVSFACLLLACPMGLLLWAPESQPHQSSPGAEENCKPPHRRRRIHFVSGKMTRTLRGCPSQRLWNPAVQGTRTYSLFLAELLEKNIRNRLKWQWSVWFRLLLIFSEANCKSPRFQKSRNICFQNGFDRILGRCRVSLKDISSISTDVSSSPGNFRFFNDFTLASASFGVNLSTPWTCSGQQVHQLEQSTMSLSSLTSWSEWPPLSQDPATEIQNVKIWILHEFHAWLRFALFPVLLSDTFQHLPKMKRNPLGVFHHSSIITGQYSTGFNSSWTFVHPEKSPLRKVI